MNRSLKRFVPPVIIYAGIFYLSAQPASAFPDILPDIVPHFLEYLVLGFFLMRAAVLGSHPAPETTRRAPLIKTFIICGAILLLLAFLDELHQYYVPTRFFQVKDILVDFLGGITGMVLYVRMRGREVEG